MGSLSGEPLTATHEIKSDFPKGPHETESEFPPGDNGKVHEIESDFPEEPHEIKSEVLETMHEIRWESVEAAEMAALAE